MPRVNERLMRQLEPPPTGNCVVWDDTVTGFGARITAAGAKSFVLRYVLNGRERRYTIGKFPDLTGSAAREIAIEKRGLVASGSDPLEERHLTRTAPTVRELGEDYLKRHAEVKKRPGSVRDDRAKVQDLSALDLWFEPTEGDPVWRLVVKFYCPEENIGATAQRQASENP